MTTFRFRFLTFLTACLAMALIIGCAALQRAPMPALTEDVPAAVELDAVPFFPQDEYQCGPASLAMAMAWIGMTITPDELKDQVYSPSRKGSLQLSLVSATRRRGKLAFTLSGPGAIFPEIAAGQPVIILQNLGLSWLPVWHYAVVIGYDVPARKVILRSGTTRRKVMSYDLFQRTWARSDYWGMMVLEPNQLPVLAKEDAYLEAVLGLEQSRHFQAAAAGYQTALTRWPQSLTAYMGLGLSKYKLRDLKEAEKAFRKATEIHPLSAPAFNNLAHVLMEQGRLQEALATARKAVSLGGPQKSKSEETLQEIQSSMP